MPESRISISNLSPWQEFLSKKFPGKNAKFTNEQFLAAADEFFGPIPIPPGSQIISQNAGGAEYIDPEGYTHRVRRELNGLNPNAGEIQDNTNRPNILPPAGAVATLPADLANYARTLMGPVALAQLDPETAAALEAITSRDQMALQEQFDREQAEQLAALYGNRVNQSSIATNALGDLLQKQGLVKATSQADANARKVAIQQYLTQAGQQRNSDLLALLQNLAGQQTQRDVAGGQLGLGYRELGERGRQFNKEFELRQQMADLALATARKGSDVFGNALQGLAGSLISYGLGRIPGLSGGGGGGGGSVTGGYYSGGRYIGE